MIRIRMNSLDMFEQKGDKETMFINLILNTSASREANFLCVILERFRLDFHYRYRYVNQSFSQSDELGLPN